MAGCDRIEHRVHLSGPIVRRHFIELRFDPDRFFRSACGDHTRHPTRTPTHHHPPSRIGYLVIVRGLRLEQHQMTIQFFGK